MLKPEHFRVAATYALTESNRLTQWVKESLNRDPEVVEALQLLRKKGPRRLISGLLDWEEDDGLVYHKSKLYIPDNKDLCLEIVKSCHNTPLAGHSGKHGTLELVSRHYWWPHMAAFVE